MTTWKGREVPETVAAWFDQLMDSTVVSVVEVASHSRYVDVILTVSPLNGVTRVPDVVVKGEAKPISTGVDNRPRRRIS